MKLYLRFYMQAENSAVADTRYPVVCTALVLLLSMRFPTGWKYRFTMKVRFTMSEQRLRLDGILRRVLQETVGEIHLYYQPPANLKMQYPCIRYDLNRIRNVHADGHVYLQHPSYTVTVMTKTPDSDLTAAVSRLDQCRHDRSYIADNLYHDVFTMTV